MKHIDKINKTDRLRIDAFFEALKGQGIRNYELYESPLLYIVYVEEEIYFQMEENIESLSQIINESSCDLSKPILCAPESFKASYEQKIEIDQWATWNISIPENLFWEYNIQYDFDNISAVMETTSRDYRHIENSSYHKKTISISIKDSYGYAA